MKINLTWVKAMAKQYVDGYVLVVQKKNLKSYEKMASEAGKIWMKYGALQYLECVGEDLKSAKKWGCLPFPKMTKAKQNETVLFSFIIYNSKAHRDEVNAKVMKEMKKNEKKYKEECKNVFDMKRMAVGGFETIVNLDGK
jgi:uncharacterized protein YbaA (DUF1428 family)